MAMTLKVLNPRREEGTVKGYHVLFGVLSFFATVFAVNGYFLFAALSTHSGVVAQEPYRKGLEYNARIAADERQTELGWHDDVNVTGDGKVSVTVLDREARPLSGLDISGTIGRPSTVRYDRTFRLAEPERGRYAADVGALEPGNWIIAIEARSGEETEPAYRARRRLWLKR
jgi:nitrogen fixation protein FixH